MLKHSETIINAKVRRQDATWDYHSDHYNSDNPDTIFERPELTSSIEGDDTWYFNGDASELRKYDSSTWDPNHPVFEYQVQDPVVDPPDKGDPEGKSGQGPNSVTDEWDDSHQYNPTRYLRPGNSNFITIKNSVQNVTIDPVPPKFISDYGTEYLSLECAIDGKIKQWGTDQFKFSTATRTIQLAFQDDVGLDQKQFALYLGDEEIDWGNITPETFESNENIISYYDRKLEKRLDKPYVENVFFNTPKSSQYQVNITLFESWVQWDYIHQEIVGNPIQITSVLNDKEADIILNKDGNIITRKKFTEAKLNLIVWDLAGNYSIYKIKSPFNTLSLKDLNDLVPVNILFTDIEPDNYFLEDGVEGKIITKVYDPNDVLWEYENVAKLIEGSIGVIDKGSYEAGDNRKHSPLDGVREFIITHLTESGNVEVEAWVETGFPEIDALIKERTYNTAICGPWIYGDEGRKYHITPYVPKYLHGTEFADFMEFFQLYINTMYQGMETKRNISGLEKIARIGNFNDISRLENSLIYHYANQFGNEFDFNVESVQNVNLVSDGSGFTTRDIKETFDIIKYVLEELPAYNRYKGTNTGMALAIQMFGFTCKIINVWVHRQNEIEKTPDFVEENRLYSVEDYFMTSRFDLEVGGKNNTFRTFCDNIDMFIDLIKSIKPITKILNYIKYTLYSEVNANLVYDLDELNDENAHELTYDFTWRFDKDHKNETYNIEKLCKLDPYSGTADMFCLSYIPTNVKCTSSEGEIPVPKMCYNILGKFLKSHFDKIILKVTSQYGNEKKSSLLEFNRDGLQPLLKAGSFFLYFNKTSNHSANGTNCYNMINRHFDFGSLYNSDTGDYVEIKMKFKLQMGTDFAVSENPT